MGMIDCYTELLHVDCCPAQQLEPQQCKRDLETRLLQCTANAMCSAAARSQGINARSTAGSLCSHGLSASVRFYVMHACLEAVSSQAVCHPKSLVCYICGCLKAVGSYLEACCKGLILVMLVKVNQHGQPRHWLAVQHYQILHQQSTRSLEVMLQTMDTGWAGDVRCLQGFMSSRVRKEHASH